MTLLAATDNAPTPTLDTRRITEADPDYVRLHARYSRRLRASIATLVRGLREHDQGATTAFIHRHVDLMREAYVAAHEEGQRDYWHTVSLKRAPVADPDPRLIEQRLAWYALGSVLKMAHEAQQAHAASRGRITHSDLPNAQNRIVAPYSPIYTLAGDPDPLAQWQASTDTRAGLQAAIGWAGIQDGYLAGGRNDGASPFALVWWELDPAASHCFECPQMAADSPYNAPGSGGNELDRTPGDGRTECGAGCKCSLAYKPAAEREAIATASAWADYYNTLQGNAVPAEPSRIEQFKAYGRGEAPAGSFGRELAQRLPNEPLIVPPQVPIEEAQKRALDTVRAARDAWAKVRADYPDLPEYPWYYSDNAGEHAVPLLYGQFYDYAEVAAALERLWDANAIWLSLQVAGDTEIPDTELAERWHDGMTLAEWIALGGHEEGYEQARKANGQWDVTGNTGHVGGIRGVFARLRAAIAGGGLRGARGGGGANVHFDEGALERLSARMGRKLSKEDVAGLAGALRGDTVRVDKHGQLHVTSADGERSHIVHVLDATRLLNIATIDAQTGAHLGQDPRSLAVQVHAARRLGVESFHAKAAYPREYETMPELGYNRRVDAHLIIETKSRHYPPVAGHTLLDVLSTPEGRVWWHAEGITPDLYFDPGHNSQSVRQLNTVLAALHEPEIAP